MINSGIQKLLSYQLTSLRQCLKNPARERTVLVLRSFPPSRLDMALVAPIHSRENCVEVAFIASFGAAVGFAYSSTCTDKLPGVEIVPEALAYARDITDTVSPDVPNSLSWEWSVSAIGGDCTCDQAGEHDDGGVEAHGVGR